MTMDDSSSSERLTFRTRLLGVAGFGVIVAGIQVWFSAKDARDQLLNGRRPIYPWTLPAIHRLGPDNTGVWFCIEALGVGVLLLRSVERRVGIACGSDWWE